MKERISNTDIFFDSSTVSEEQKNLVIALLQNGYIDENYSDYVHGGNLSKNDKLFLSCIANKISPDKGFEHPLNNKKALLEKISADDFLEPYILNYQLLDYLQASARADANSWQEQRINIFNFMADKSETSINFVNGFIERENVDVAQFLKEISPYWKEKNHEDIAFSEAIIETNKYKLWEKGNVSKESIEAYRNKDKGKNKESKEAQTWDIMFDDPDLKDLEMVRVEGGTFWMGGTEEQGAESSDDEKPVHEVTLDSFSIGKYPVTQAQWTQIMGTNPSHFAQGRNYPVEMVSWHDAQEFCKLLNVITGKNYRLPTEAEWEYAARGGNNASSQTMYSGSNTIDEVAWYSENSNHTTHPVGEKKANELGIYDMSGNVWEWCSDRYGDYPAAPQTNPQGALQGSNRVCRGGGWYDNASDCRVAIRDNITPSSRDDDLGFRLVLPELPAKKRGS